MLPNHDAVRDLFPSLVKHRTWKRTRGCRKWSRALINDCSRLSTTLPTSTRTTTRFAGGRSGTRARTAAALTRLPCRRPAAAAAASNMELRAGDVHGLPDRGPRARQQALASHSFRTFLSSRGRFDIRRARYVLTAHFVSALVRLRLRCASSSGSLTTVPSVFTSTSGSLWSYQAPSRLQPGFVRIAFAAVILQDVLCVTVPDLQVRCAVLERVDRAACVGALGFDRVCNDARCRAQDDEEKKWYALRFPPGGSGYILDSGLLEHHWQPLPPFSRVGFSSLPRTTRPCNSCAMNWLEGTQVQQRLAIALSLSCDSYTTASGGLPPAGLPGCPSAAG